MTTRTTALALTFVLSASAAGATTLNFAGSVKNGLGTLTSGMTLSGSLTYDETASPRLGGLPNQTAFDAVTAMSFTIGAFGSSVNSPGGSQEIQIDNDVAGTGDRFGLTTRTSDGFLAASVLDSTYTLTGFSFRLDDPGGTVFSTAQTLPQSVDFGDFSSGAFFLFFEDDQNNLSVVDGSLTRLATVPSAIPVPAGLPMFLAALAGLGMIARRRRV